MHCSQKTFHILSVCNCPTSFLWNILVTLRKSHETILWDIFEKSQILARHVFETFQRCHEKDIFFEICSRRLKDVIQKTSFFEMFLKRLKDVTKKSSFLRCFWEVSKMPLNGDLIEISQRHLIGLCLFTEVRYRISKKSAVNIIEYFSFSKNGIAQCVSTKKFFQRV